MRAKQLPNGATILNLGRVVRLGKSAQLRLPAEDRRALGINEGDYLHCQVENGRLVLTPVSLVAKQVEDAMSETG